MASSSSSNISSVIYILIVFSILNPVLSSKNDICYEQFGDEFYKPHPDMHVPTYEVITRYGYPVEIHEVTTEDGYILTLFRISAGKNEAKPVKVSKPISKAKVVSKPAVFLNHGLFANAQIWLLQHGSRNLAFKLADEGFDVWLANGRGTMYSKYHRTLASDDPAYWDFSFHEMGIYDVPVVFRYITNKTAQKKIYYIGHSMGSTSFFVAMSEIPELNDLVATAVLYAPVAILHNTKSIGGHVAPIGEELYILTQDMLNGKFSGKKFFEDNLGENLGEICSYSAMACGLCSDVNAMLFGSDPLQMNYTLQSLFFSLVPDTVSTKTLLHFCQLINSKRFQQFDYGFGEENGLRYGSRIASPPEYNLAKITAPMVFVWSDNDNLATPMDVNLTASKLNPNALKESIRVDWTQWTHRDYIKGIDADKLVYDRTISIFKQKLYG